MASDGRVVIDSILNSDGVKRGVADIKSSLNSIKNASAGVSKNMSGALSAAVTMVGAAAAGALVKSVKAGVAFESAFAGVRKTVSANEREFAAMHKEIIGMSKAMPQSAVEISQVAEAAGQLGIAKENVTDFAKTMVMIGETTNMTSDQAATAFARFANITGMSAKNYDRLGSTVVALGNNMATTEGEIVDMSMRLAGTGHMIGLTESQILGVSAAMSSVGINAEAGGSAMSRTMQKMNTAVLDGGSKLKSFASVAGMSANEFASAWRTNPSKALTSFVKGLDGVKRSGGNVAKVLKDLGIGSIQEVDTLMRLSGASDELTKALDLSAKAWGDNSALAKEYGERTKTLESRFKVLMNQVTALGIKIFDALRPALSAIVSMASLAVKALDLIPGPVLAAGLSLVAFAGFIPPVLAGLRAFGLTTLTGAQGLIAFKGIVLGFGRALLGAVASPVGATVAVLAGLAFAAGNVVKHWTNIKAVMTAAASSFPILGAAVKTLDGPITGFKKMVEGIKEAVSGIAAPIAKAAGDVVSKAGALKTALGALFSGMFSGESINAQALVDGVSKAFNGLISSLPALGSALAAGFSTIKDSVSQAMSGIFDGFDASSILSKVGELVPGIAARLLLGAPGLAVSGAMLLNNIAEGFGTSLPELVGKGAEVVANLGMGLAQAIPQLSAKAVEMINAFSQAASTAIPQLAAAAVQIIQGMTTGFSQALPQMTTAAVQVIQGLASGFAQALPQLTAAALQLITALIQGIVQAAPMLIMAGLQMLMALIQGITQALPQIIAAITAMIPIIVTTLTAAIPMLLEAGIQLFTALVEGVVQVLPEILAALAQLGIAIIQAIIQLAPQLLQAGVQIITALLSGILSMLGAIVGAAGQLIAGALGAILGFVGQMLSAGVQLISGLIQGVGSKASAVASKVRTTVQQGITAVKNKVGEMVSAGADLIRGLARGIANAAGEAIASAAKVAGDVAGKIKSFFRIGSPSKLMHQYGVWIDQGLANGIDKAAKEPVKAAGAMAEKVIDTTSKALDIKGNISSEGHRQGLTLGEGLAQGITANKNKPKAAAEDQAQAVAQAVYQQVTKSAAKLSGVLAQETESLAKKTMDAQKAYHDGANKILEDLKTKEKTITDAYAKELDSRTSKLEKWVGLFDEVPKRAEVSGQELLQNLKSQNLAFEQWQENLASITKRGINEGLLKELQEAGPKAAAQLEALLSLSDKAWEDYQAEYARKSSLAASQAFIDTTNARKKMMEDIAKARSEAQGQLVDKAGEYAKALYEAGAAAQKTFKEKGVQVGADFIDQFIAGVRGRAPMVAKESGKTVAEMAKAMGLDTMELPILPALKKSESQIEAEKATFQQLGEQLMKGAAQGVKDGKSGMVSALVDAVRAALSAAQEELGIHSPSRVMRDEVGKWIPAGMAEGITSNAGILAKASEMMAKVAMPDIGSIAMPRFRPAFAGSYGAGAVDNSRHYASNVHIENVNTSEAAQDIKKIERDLAWLEEQRRRGLGG